MNTTNAYTNDVPLADVDRFTAAIWEQLHDHLDTLPEGTVKSWADLDPELRLSMMLRAGDTAAVGYDPLLINAAVGVLDALLIVRALPGAAIIVVDFGRVVVDESTPWWR